MRASASGQARLPPGGLHAGVSASPLGEPRPSVLELGDPLKHGVVELVRLLLVQPVPRPGHMSDLLRSSLNVDGSQLAHSFCPVTLSLRIARTGQVRAARYVSLCGCRANPVRPSYSPARESARTCCGAADARRSCHVRRNPAVADPSTLWHASCASLTWEGPRRPQTQRYECTFVKQIGSGLDPGRRR